MIGSYDAPTGREAVLRFGPQDAAPLLILPPLFEEANRTRLFLVTVMRRLADSGIATALPDLPGCNDSPVATVDARFEDWRSAVAELVARLRPCAVAAFRGGALLDGAVDTASRWRLAPESGARVVRDMIRSTAMGSGVKASVLEARARTEPTRLAGNLLHPALYTTLETAIVEGSARTVRLTDDASDADARIDGSPLWRRAEPGIDATLVDGVVTDVRAWLR